MQNYYSHHYDEKHISRSDWAFKNRLFSLINISYQCNKSAKYVIAAAAQVTYLAMAYLSSAAITLALVLNYFYYHHRFNS